MPFFALQNYLAVVGVERCIMVTDAISAARLGPGLYRLGGEPVEVDETGAARRPGAANLAGSTLTMPRLRENLARELGFTEPDLVRVLDANPRAAVRLEG